MLFKKCIPVFIGCLFFVSLSGQKALPLIPFPESVRTGGGFFQLSARTGIIDHTRDKNLSQILKKYIEEDFCLNVQERSGSNRIVLEQQSGLQVGLGEEGYRISVTPQEIKITSATSAGIFYGIQTLRQLVDGRTLEIPCLEISDRPAYSWRAFMLDEARHFKGKEVVKQLMEEMAFLKMNVFHWHLTDDEGWRIEIKKYPKMTKVGAYRDSTQIGGKNSALYDKRVHGGYYTQEDIREIVRFASERNITIVPEIEMPGHATAAIASYPEVGATLHPVYVASRFNPRSSVYNVADPETVKFLENVLSEVFDLFPGKMVHIGGDEIYTDEWEKNPVIKQFMEKKGIMTYNDLQVYFTNRINKYAVKHKRRIIGWNDIMGKNIHEWSTGKNNISQVVSREAVVQFWKGDAGLITDALEKGHDVINSSHRDTYLDYSYEKLPLRKSYSFSPFPDGVDSKYHPALLGLGCQMWSEWIPAVKDLHRQVFPRIAAYAEVGWTMPENKDYSRFLRSLSFFKSRWDKKGIGYGCDKDFTD